MIYVKPNYSIPDVNKGGRLLADMLTMPGKQFAERRTRGDFVNAIDVVENWRASHAFPLNSFHVTLRGRAAHVHPSALTAQRLKRLESIAFKLVNEEDMKLSQMQDIGGCRAIMPTLAKVNELRQLYLDRPVTHTFNGEKDYIANPKDTGYRGIHLKYRFVGKATSRHWNSLKIEIQLRTLLQHRWATAVEAVGTFTQQPLKSSQGKKEWLRFFTLMASVFAIREGCCTVPGAPQTLAELRDQINDLNARHHMQATLAQYRKIIPTIANQRDAKYFLVKLDPVQQKVSIQGYKFFETRTANRAYTEAETETKSTNVVLVSANSIAALKRAYPNYFLDTRDFLRDVSQITGRRDV